MKGRASAVRGSRADAREWRVEIVKRCQTHWHRIVHGDNQLEWISIAAVERILAEASIDMADLVAAKSERSLGSNSHHGAA